MILFGAGDVARKFLQKLIPKRVHFIFPMEFECQEVLTPMSWDSKRTTSLTPRSTPPDTTGSNTDTGVQCLPTYVSDPLDTLNVWRDGDRATWLCLNKTPTFRELFCIWVDEVKQSVAIRQVNPLVAMHAVHLFVRYVNVVYTGRGDQRRAWTRLAVYRMVALWIALKFEDMRYDDPETVTECPTQVKGLVCKERVFMAAIGYNMSRPRNYIDVMCNLTSCTDIYDASVAVIQKFLDDPTKWNGQRHIDICATVMMIASENVNMEDARQTKFIKELSVLTHTSITHLLEMAIHLSECAFI